MLAMGCFGASCVIHPKLMKRANIQTTVDSIEGACCVALFSSAVCARGTLRAIANASVGT